VWSRIGRALIAPWHNRKYVISEIAALSAKVILTQGAMVLWAARRH
jgi:hypothetical protein